MCGSETMMWKEREVEDKSGTTEYFVKRRERMKNKIIREMVGVYKVVDKIINKAQWNSMAK